MPRPVLALAAGALVAALPACSSPAQHGSGAAFEAAGACAVALDHAAGRFTLASAGLHAGRVEVEQVAPPLREAAAAAQAAGTAYTSALGDRVVGPRGPDFFAAQARLADALADLVATCRRVPTA